MTLQYISLMFYSFLYEQYISLSSKVEQIYNDLEMQVVNNTFTEIYFYDYCDMKKVVLRNNTTYFQIFWLLLKQLLGFDITDDLRYNLDEIFLHYLQTYRDGIFEIVYYKDRKKIKYYTRGHTWEKLYSPTQHHIVLKGYFNEETLLKHMMKKPHKNFLHATINDKHTVTWFVNEHLSSFNSRNKIKVADMIIIMKLNNHITTDVNEETNYLMLIDNDTLDEITYNDNKPIIIVRDD